MNPVQLHLARFRMARLAAVAVGIVVPASLLIAALAGYRSGSISGTWAFACVALAIGGSFAAAYVYRCPKCRKGPESEIPMFFPEACCHCGTRLR